MSATIRYTTCVLDCPDACGLEVEVRDRRVVAIRAAPGDAATGGFICGKVTHFHRRLDHPERILHPMRRAGVKGDGRFERITWEEAVDAVAGRLAEVRDRWGGEAILPFHYGGSNGLLTDDLVDDLLFARLGASRLAKTICAVPATRVALGMYGKMPGVAFSDFPEARLIVVWGANPKGSNIHLVPWLKEARRRGARVVTVDPRRTLAEGDVDLHLPVLPGQDLAVALALIHRWETRGELDRHFLERWADGVEPLLEAAREWTLERAARTAGVEVADLARLADLLAEADPALVRCGWGLERNRNGAQAIAAVLAIPALLGKFGKRGGGYTLSNNGAVKLDRGRLLGRLDWSTRRLNMTQLGRLLAGPLEPPVKALFVYNANPAATVPEQRAVLAGLARDDLFTVVHEQVMTDTARFADVLLPARTFFEGHDLRSGYGSYVVGGIRPVVEAAGEAISNMELFGRLGRALGFDDPVFGWDDDELLRRAAEALEIPGGNGAATLAAGGRVTYGFEGAAPIPFVNSFPLTADGKVHLTPPDLGAEPYRYREPERDHPLALVTPASHRLINSTLGETNLPRLEVTLHPDDARARGVAAGDAVRVWNDRGEVRCRLAVSAAVRPGVASMPKGAWRRSSENGLTSTALCPDDAQVVGDAACFNDARVEVAAVSRPGGEPGGDGGA
ncbi:MAG: molybdopterin-dependent oxidoreductase [Thermoanaerobaculia bacterium]|nr:molybdopterin-dependent oxidoreductase [Thermoanaerobaculia bacterium]